MSTEKTDTYIAKSAPFARPVLAHFRHLVHSVCADAEETLKWGFPHFIKDGKVICYMAAFKQHCAIGFRNAELMPDPEGILHKVGESGMGSLGKITGLQDLPPDVILKKYIAEAVEVNHLSVPKKKTVSTAVEIPADFAEAIAAKTEAKAQFDKFSNSHRKEYVEWIMEAKREETRRNRIAQAVEWIAEGKSRNWKYMK
ncbi:MAG: YdeI/OmpD-associated family protein [Flavobacteriales bacterium]|nr:YdeI/OmpD-associated family protein [Flavobacteriales bacterium]